MQMGAARWRRLASRLHVASAIESKSFNELPGRKGAEGFPLDGNARARANVRVFADRSEIIHSTPNAGARLL